MNTQPEALRLADVFEFMRDMQRSEREGWRYADELEQERKRLHEVNQELLEALQGFMAGAEAMGWNTEKARAAIAKATGEQA